MRLVEQSEINLDGLITLPEAALLIDLREQYVRKLVQSGKIAGRKFGRNYLGSRDSALAFQRTPGRGRPRVMRPRKRPAF